MATTTVTENTQRIPTADGGYRTTGTTTTTTEEARKLNTQSGMSTREAIDQYYNSMKEPVNAQITQAGNDYQAALQRLQSLKEQQDAENYRSYVRQQNELPGLMRASGNNGGMIDSAVASLANAYNQARARRGLEYEANVAGQDLDYNNRLAELRAQLSKYDQMAGADRAELDAYNAYLAEQERLAAEERARQEAAAAAAAAAARMEAERARSYGGSSKSATTTGGVDTAASEEFLNHRIDSGTSTLGGTTTPAQKNLQAVIAAQTDRSSPVNSNDPTRLQNVVYEYDGTAPSAGKTNLPQAAAPLTSQSGGNVVNSSNTVRLQNVPSTYDKGTTSTAATKKSSGSNTSKTTGFTSKVLPSVKK